MTQDHAAEQEWIEKMRQFQNKPAPVEFIPVSPSTLPEMEHPYQLSGPKWEPPSHRRHHFRFALEGRNTR